jgi:hypothetical protein
MGSRPFLQYRIALIITEWQSLVGKETRLVSACLGEDVLLEAKPEFSDLRLTEANPWDHQPSM